MQTISKEDMQKCLDALISDRVKPLDVAAYVKSYFYALGYTGFLKAKEHKQVIRRYLTVRRHLSP
jgi:hypothetical protein